MICWPNGLDAEAFLAGYWQKRPLLLPAALPDFHCPLSGDELAGLACEADTESRLISRSADDWKVRHGPFSEADFSQQAETGWTLLVQDVEKHLPELASVLAHFDFLPRWRLDDLMISYAAPEGTVGPHLDDYDVFLIQGQGRRSWAIDPAPEDLSMLPDLELKILRTFAEKERFNLGVGDILYLPPGVAHHGFSDNSCITLSVGFRAPAAGDFLRTMANMLEADSTTRRYSDADLGLAEVCGSEIPVTAVMRMSEAVALDSGQVAECFGRTVTEVKPWLRAGPSTDDETVADILDRFRQGDSLQRHSMSRYAWIMEQDCLRLFADGESWRLPPECGGFARAVCDAMVIGPEQLDEWRGCDAVIGALREIVGQGSLVWRSDLYSKGTEN
jgi:50S ribosomal protein L16 3-hydroxylase